VGSAIPLPSGSLRLRQQRFQFGMQEAGTVGLPS